MTIFQLAKLFMKIPNGITKNMWYNMKVAVMTPTGIQFLGTTQANVIELMNCSCKNCDTNPIVLVLETEDFGKSVDQMEEKLKDESTPKENTNKDIVLTGDNRHDIAEVALFEMKQKSAKN